MFLTAQITFYLGWVRPPNHTHTHAHTHTHTGKVPCPCNTHTSSGKRSNTQSGGTRGLTLVLLTMGPYRSELLLQGLFTLRCLLHLWDDAQTDRALPQGVSVQLGTYEIPSGLNTHYWGVVRTSGGCMSAIWVVPWPVERASH